jgi:hypothetical protein
MVRSPLQSGHLSALFGDKYLSVAGQSERGLEVAFTYSLQSGAASFRT